MIRRTVSAMWLENVRWALPVFRRQSDRPRLRLGAEPDGTVRWSHRSLLALPSWFAVRLLTRPARGASRTAHRRRGAAVPLCRTVKKSAPVTRRRQASWMLRAKCDRVPAPHPPDIMLSASCSTFVLSPCRPVQNGTKAGKLVRNRRASTGRPRIPTSAVRPALPGRSADNKRGGTRSWSTTSTFPFAARASTT